MKPANLNLVVGESKDVRAWLCTSPGQGELPYGEDGKPNTEDDDCSPANKAKWSFKDDGFASLEEAGETAVNRVTAEKVTDGTRVKAEQGERKGGADLVIVAAPAPTPPPQGSSQERPYNY